MIALVLVGALAATGPATRAATVGSKAFPESWILADALVALCREEGLAAEHRANLGGTEIAYQALTSGAIDAYPEYTGTIAEVILKRSDRPSPEQLRAELGPRGLGMSAPLGFNDGYALAVSRKTADALRLRTLSDLARHPELRLGLSHEFLGRSDGWPGLKARYRLDNPVKGLQHELSYEAIASGAVDAIDIYTTDAQLQHLGLVVLDDDRGYFPRYDAVFLYRLDARERVPGLLAAIARLEGRIDEAAMIRANAKVVLEHAPSAEVASALVSERLGVTTEARSGSGRAHRIARNTLTHLQLCGIALLFAVVLGIPLGVLATRSRAIAAVALSFTGVLQTIPSLALLALLIPLLGIGRGPALVALVLYALLPVVRNTYTGLSTLAPALLESAEALGLSPAAQLFRVRLPLASPAILAGVKTSAVITIGTATLAALIGAGGLGTPILSGISLRDPGLILEGAIPAAVLALLVEGGFSLLDRVLVPRGLRLARS